MQSNGPGGESGAVAMRRETGQRRKAVPALADDEGSDEGDDLVVGEGWVDRVGEG
jgi:hypothetical protein